MLVAEIDEIKTTVRNNNTDNKEMNGIPNDNNKVD